MLLCLRLRALPISKRCYFTHNGFKPVNSLQTFDLETFRSEYFRPGFPVILRNLSRSIPAISRWFEASNDNPSIQKLKTAYLHQYGPTVVPLELTRPNANADSTEQTFERFEAPLSFFLQYTTGSVDPSTRLYLAQCSIDDLPQPLREDVPVPEIVRKAGKGDIYASSVWLGRAPTYTPLHRDPNPNLFMQMAGTKVVRLMTPEVGRQVYERARSGEGHANLRGNEMMAGAERKRLDDAVWGTGSEGGWEAKLGIGDALFIPLGWWHSVKGTGEGINGSVNFWFR